MKEKFRTVRLLVFALVLVSLFLWSNTIQVWDSDSYIGTYSIIGVNNKSFIITLLEDNYAYMVYQNDSDVKIDYVRMRGQYGKHIIGDLWLIDNHDSLLDLRLISTNYKPVAMEIEMIETVFIQSEKVKDSSKGDLEYHNMLFSSDSIDIMDMVLTKDKELHMDLITYYESIKN